MRSPRGAKDSGGMDEEVAKSSGPGGDCGVVLAWIVELMGGRGAGGAVLLVMGVMLGAYYGMQISRNYSARVEQARQDLTSGRKPGERRPTSSPPDRANER